MGEEALMAEDVISSFLNGTCFDAYKYFGAHYCKEGVVFRVYAPGATSVSLIGDFNNWQDTAMIRIDLSGIWTCCIYNAQPGQCYKYRVYSPSLPEPRDRCDPFGRQSELRPNTASILLPHESFLFSDEEWRCYRSTNHYEQPLHIYEVHAGSWRHHPNGQPYSYRELATPLIQYCKEHFYTHVEFLPLSEYPFDGSWGYQVSGYFSITSRYGTPNDFCWLVNEFHKSGIGVIMDFVPIHFIPDEFSLARFDGTALYEYDETTGLRMSEWGSCNFDFTKPFVRSFLQSAADFWLSECHIDGLRFDAIRNAIYVQGDEQRGLNQEGIAFLKFTNEKLKQRHPDCLLIAEDSTNFIKVTAPVPYGGLGFDYKWDLGWMNDTLSYFSLSPDERPNAYHKLTFSMNYFYDNLFLLPLSHDEVVHGKKTILDKMWGSYEEKFAQSRAFYTYFYTHPGKKLIFMGNEIGSFREWSESCELDWNLLKFPIHSGFNCYLTGLAGLYFASPALYAGEYNPSCFHWVEADDQAHCVYAYERKVGGNRLLIVLNLSDQTYMNYTLHFKQPIQLSEILNSDQCHYGGRGRVNNKVIQVYRDGEKYSASVILASFSGVIFRIL